MLHNKNVVLTCLWDEELNDDVEAVYWFREKESRLQHLYSYQGGEGKIINQFEAKVKGVRIPMDPNMQKIELMKTSVDDVGKYVCMVKVKSQPVLLSASGHLLELHGKSY